MNCFACVIAPVRLSSFPRLSGRILIGPSCSMHFRRLRSWSFCRIRTAHPDWLAKLTIWPSIYTFTLLSFDESTMSVVQWKKWDEAASLWSCVLSLLGLLARSGYLHVCVLIAIYLARSGVVQPQQTNETTLSDSGEMPNRLSFLHNSISMLFDHFKLHEDSRMTSNGKLCYP